MSLKDKAWNPFKVCYKCYEVQFENKEGTLPDSCNDCKNFGDVVRLEDAQQELNSHCDHCGPLKELTNSLERSSGMIASLTDGCIDYQKRIEGLEARFEEVQLAIESRKRHVDACKFLNKAPHAEMKFLGELRKILKISVKGKEIKE